MQSRLRSNKPPFKVLHVAPEKGLYNWLSKDERVVYQSISLRDPEDDYPTETLNMNLEETSFENESFDYILCSHVLEHVQDDNKAMKEMHRILAPQGLALIQIPIKMELATTAEDPNITDPAERTLLYGQWNHLRQYGRDFMDKLESNRFTVKVITATEILSELDLHRACIPSDEMLFLAQKKE